MKKLFATMLIATVFFTVSASAQRDGGGRMERVKQYLTDSLGVSATNTDSIMAISQRSMMQVRSVMQDQSLSQDEKRDKIKPLREEMKTEMKKYLTDGQAAKLEQKQMEWRQNRGAGGGGRRK